MEAATPTGPTIDHATYLGASDIGCVVGENHMSRDASDVWGEKKSILHFEGTEATDIGNVVERPILDVWAARRGCELTFPGTMLHPDEKWAGATADMIVDAHTAGEFKMVGGQMAHAWGPAHLGAEGVPAVTVCQNHWQTWILRANGFDIRDGVVVACFGTETRTYEIDIQDDLIDELVERGREWWQHYVVGDVRPEGRAGRKLVAAVHPANVRAKLDPMTTEVFALAVDYDNARGDEKRAKEEKECLYPRLCELVGDGSGFEGDGARVTWRANRSGTRSLNVKIKAER